MKKIISLLCVVVMAFSFITVANAADANTVSFTYKVEDGVLSITETVNSTYDIAYIKVAYDVTELAKAGAVWMKEDVVNPSFSGGNVNVATKSGKTNAIFNFSTVESVPAGEYDVVTMKFDISAVADGTYAITLGSGNKITADGGTVVTTKFTMNGGNIVIAPAGGEDVNKGYEDLAATVTVATGSTIDGQPTDWQVGTGFKAEFEVPAALDSMKWSAEIDGERMYSKDYDLTGFAGIEVGSPVVLYGAFTNGARVNNEFGKTDVTKTVNEANAGIILKSGETFYASANAIAE